MLIDITLKITPAMIKVANGNEKKTFTGHLGTHFDIMNKEFPLEYTQRKGIIFDVSNIHDRDIDIKDIDLAKTDKDMFVAFYTGFIEKENYGTFTYFHAHPQLSQELIEALVQKQISLIGIDFAGVRNGKEHTPADQYCADHNVFIIENLCNLKSILDNNEYFIANTYPMNFKDMSGLPCHVVVEIQQKQHYRSYSAVFPILLKEVNGTKQVLLHKRINTGYKDNMWDLAGTGHVDKGETAKEAVVRECKEELGIDVDPNSLIYAHLSHNVDTQTDHTYYNMYFFVNRYTGEPAIMEPEKNAELKWFDINELPEDMIPVRRIDLSNSLNHQYYSENINEHKMLQ